MKKRNLVPMIVLASSLALMACSGGEDASKEAGQEQEANQEEEAEEGEGKEDQDEEEMAEEDGSEEAAETVKADPPPTR